jgi:hypothetical protein
MSGALDREIVIECKRTHRLKACAKEQKQRVDMLREWLGIRQTAA